MAGPGLVELLLGERRLAGGLRKPGPLGFDRAAEPVAPRLLPPGRTRRAGVYLGGAPSVRIQGIREVLPDDPRPGNLLQASIRKSREDRRGAAGRAIGTRRGGRSRTARKVVGKGSRGEPRSRGARNAACVIKFLGGDDRFTRTGSAHGGRRRAAVGEGRGRSPSLRRGEDAAGGIVGVAHDDTGFVRLAHEQVAVVNGRGGTAVTR